MGSKTRNFRLTRVEAPTMTEALQKIRAQLGSDAMIISTRTFRRGGVLGVGAQEIVEVYAADTRSRIENIKRESSSRGLPAGRGADVPPTRGAEARPARGAEVAPARGTEVATTRGAGVPPVRGGAPAALCAADAPRPAAAPQRADAGSPAKPPPGATSASATPTGVTPAGESYQVFSSAIGQIRQEIRDLISHGEGARHANPFLRECHDLLVSREVDPRVADLIVEEISRLRLPSGFPEPSRVRAVVRSQLTKLFAPSPSLGERRRPRTIVLVGPTGVGKTTTIAKLAAKAKLTERRRVGLITLDTFRIAAVDQLEKYAEIIGLPLIVATSPRELEVAVDELRAKETDVVFIDSAGRSHRDELKMAELREFLTVLPEAEVHLVLSTTTHAKTILSIANRFSGIGFHRVILTKVDETISFGSLVSAMISIGRPVSFVTDGQNVPDDIVASDPERLADLVLKVNAL